MDFMSLKRGDVLSINSRNRASVMVFVYTKPSASTPSESGSCSKVRVCSHNVVQISVCLSGAEGQLSVQRREGLQRLVGALWDGVHPV